MSVPLSISQPDCAIAAPTCDIAALELDILFKAKARQRPVISTLKERVEVELAPGINTLVRFFSPQSDEQAQLPLISSEDTGRAKREDLNLIDAEHALHLALNLIRKARGGEYKERVTKSTGKQKKRSKNLL
jgi:hypothetical protein